ncbi:Ganglioside induced differentiation associated protein [Nesidiocoris tenuis]|uniref:Ganglioside induced differentiation associated protein n=1 Tax=Nesidiocoris tenuis TaxID=355587 RepID=A0ABN7A761_9HEMI|nr:Ganglioside induced differentiation associated protein [Nesidiocoris tenuis]
MSNKMVLVREDPLRMSPPILDVSSLLSWGDTQPVYAPTTYNINAPQESSPFPVNPTLNKKIVLWEGDITQLRVDAIVHSTNENFTERSFQSDSIIVRAGPDLKAELLGEIRECKTGDVVVTQGYRLPSKVIIHAVGPIYSMKFQTASENALHNCYRKILEKAYELKIKTLALSVIHSVRRNYPPDEGAHVAMRTIRKVLELQTARGGYLEKVVLVVESSDAGIYEILLPLYFPRNKKEESAALLQLPTGRTYGLYGEPVHPERQIRIIDNPHVINDSDCSVIDLSSHFDTMTDTSFTHMQEDLDQQRLLGERPVPSIYPDISKEIHNQERYERLLRRAKIEDLTSVSGIGCLYQSGVDRFGRPVIVFVGKWFKFKEIDLDKALLYLIYLLDPLVKKDYVIAYFHTNTSNANYPSFNWLKEVYNILPYKYKKNLKAFYIVHPTFWTKMMTWWFLTFMAPAIKQKVQSLPGIEYLYSVIHPSQLEIPAFITEHDMTINGLRYYNPNSPT